MKKQMNIEEIEKIAKTWMNDGHEHGQQLLVENPDGSLSIMALVIDDKHKEDILKSMRKFINETGVNHYYFVSEAWMSKDVDYRPRYAPDKEECLIIHEFSRDNKNKTIFQKFVRKGKKIVWGERNFLDAGAKEQYQSRWNFFLEDCSEEMFMEVKKKRTLEIIKKEGIIKRLTEEMRKRFDKDATEAQVKRTVEKMVREGKIILSAKK